MKKQVSPALMTVVIALVVVGAAVLLWRAATEKPAYPGLNAGHPAAETAGRQPGASNASASANVPKGEPVTYEQAKKMRIPGMNPNAPPPSKPPGQ
jgi:hypothetical protein